ncbi:MAG: hypothetical protein RM347_033100 [Nostoc sp. ChiQUE02]|uniref:hypothetical protein n=1 Tax=Nostoc sp. ChiQUE02 TaxID=3075377 RepID=UPI002AD56313|nr:hypothetical protein [Nostoc sp. ChiQUE02]MDZ8231910.1 hypothetical protein [Nostoc sp. ChiQUE02]
MSIKILESLNSSEIKEFKAEIVTKRSIGNILFEIKEISSDMTLEEFEDLTELLDLFVSQMGHVGLGDHWKQIHQAAGLWNLNDALIGDLSTDRKNGAKSARICNSGRVTMRFDRTTGAGSITIKYAKFGTDANTTWGNGTKKSGNAYQLSSLQLFA